MATTGYLTQNQIIALQLIDQKARLDSTRLSEVIKSDLGSDFKLDMKEGTDYYAADHDILDHTHYYWVDGQKQEDKVKANNTVPHPFHKILVEQKSAYIAGNPVAFDIAEGDEGEAQADIDYYNFLIAILDEKMDDMIPDWVIGASNKGTEWLHFYINAKGELKYVITPSEQIIPVYDTQYQEELVYVIRYYLVDVVQDDGSLQQRYKVEWWDKDQVEFWAQTDDETFVLDPEYEVNPAPHWWSYNTSDPETTREKRSWGRVPFVGLYNNNEATTDLAPIKKLIDAYDKVKSGWINDLEDFSELIYILKGFTGLSREATAGYSELALFMENLKVNKVVGVESDGAVEVVKSEIPVEAKERFLVLTRQEIFYFGEGVDVGDTENIGAAPSGVALKFLYASLDLKANRLIRKLRLALKEVAWFVTEYINETESKSFDSENVIFTINKSVIFNEKEKIDGLKASEGIISKQTMIANHPYVEDPEEEMLRVEAEEEEQAKKAEAEFQQNLALAAAKGSGQPPPPNV